MITSKRENKPCKSEYPEASVKKALLLFFRFLLSGTVLFILFCFLNIISSWSQQHNPEVKRAFSEIFLFLPSAALESFAPAVIIGIFSTFFWINRTGINRIVFILISTATAMALLFAALLILSPRYTSVSSQNESPPVLLERHLHTFNNNLLYMEKQDGNSFQTLVLIDIKEKEKRFSFISKAALSETAKEITVPGGERIALEPPNPFFSTLFTVPDNMDRLFKEFSLVTGQLVTQYETSRRTFLFYTAALCLFASCCSVFSRISKWPVVNLILSLGALRFIFFIQSFILKSPFNSTSGTALLGFDPDITLVSAILLIVSLLLLGWDLLFVKPYKAGGV